MQHETVAKMHPKDSDGGMCRRVVFTKLLSSKISAILKQMQEHLVKAGLEENLEVNWVAPHT
jgi:hypothetical protein